MNLTNSQYDQLMNQYALIRTRRMAEADERREEVYNALPRLNELDAMVRKLSLSFVGNSLENDEQARLSYEEELESIKNERASLLASHGWDEAYLEPAYDCPDCHDTGYIDGEKCHCLKTRAIKLFYDQSNLDRRITSENFDHFDLNMYPEDMEDNLTGMTSRAIMADVLNASKAFVRNFDSCFQNLLLYGNTGIGKTFLSHCIARELLEQGHSVLYLDAIHLFELLEARQFDRTLSYNDKDSMLSYILDSDLLILDDLGTEMANSFTTTQLYHVIESRLHREHSTIITTNLSIQDMNELYTERVFSRIAKYYQMLRLIGDDIRLKVS